MDSSLAKFLRAWDSPGKNTGMGSHSLLQEIYPAQASNLSLLHCRRILYLLRLGSPAPGVFGPKLVSFFFSAVPWIASAGLFTSRVSSGAGIRAPPTPSRDPAVVCGSAPGARGAAVPAGGRASRRELEGGPCWVGTAGVGGCCLGFRLLNSPKGPVPVPFTSSVTLGPAPGGFVGLTRWGCPLGGRESSGIPLAGVEVTWKPGCWRVLDRG